MTDVGVQLVLLIGNKVVSPAPAPVMNAVETVQVTQAAADSSGFQIAFAVSKASLLMQAMVPAGRFDPGVRVVICVVFHGRLTVLCDGIVTRQELSPGAEPGASRFTVTGEDLLVRMDLQDRQQSYVGRDARTQVEEIISKYAAYGIVPRVSPVLPSEVRGPSETPDTQMRSDLDHIRMLARSVGYSFYLIPGPVPGQSTAYWGPDVRAGVAQPALSVDLDAATTVDQISFSLDGLKGEQLDAKVLIPDARRSVPVDVPPVNPVRPLLAARRVVPLRESSVPGTDALTMSRVLAAANERATAGSDAVTANGRLDVARYGHLLEARRLVGVRGAGIAYDGMYYVSRVTHDLKRGQYTQSFTLVRDGLVTSTSVVPT